MDLKEGEEGNDSFEVKNSHNEVGQIFSLESKMLFNSNALPIETSHTSLDIFEGPQLLVNFDGSFEQKIGPLYAPNGPTLVFEVKGDRTIFIDIQNIYLEVKCKIVKTDNTNLIYVTGDATQQDTPVFVNNTLHSLFSDCTVAAQGVKVSSQMDCMPSRPLLKLNFPTTRKRKTLGWNVRVITTNPTLVRTPWELSQREKLKLDLQPLQLSLGELPLIFSRAKNILSVELS